ncbi:MAG: M16 family metallopeptidase [Candidatus Kapaibacterium sp.]
MMIRRIPLLTLLTICTLLLSSSLFAQSGGEMLSLDAPLPIDPAVKVGKLSNGMTYYIRANHKPEDRAELRLAVRAGSILEDDDQQGFAHFVEHMAFNGTEHFAKNDMITFLESIGMRFGADLNAFTSFDQTVYMLQVPTDKEGPLGQGLMILRDWANGLKFDAKEIDAERGVVIEEWRSRRGGEARIGDEHFKVIYEGSRYADRQPIGKKEILESGSHDALKRFYKDWYRPELMAVVAVGDFDPIEVEKMIQEQFSSIPRPANPRTRTIYDVPLQKGTRYSLAFDPESTNPALQLVIMHDRPSRDRHGDYRRSLIEQMISGMLSQRLDELRRQPDAPFLFAFGGAGLGLGGYSQFYVNARVKDGKYAEGLETILTEVERIRRYGFTEPELQRMKSSMMAGIEQYYSERDKNESTNYAREYYSNFTSDESFPGIEYEYKMYQWYVPNVSLAEVNEFARQLMKEDSRVITAGGPKKDGGDPTKEDLQKVVEEVMKSKIEPYTEEAIASALMEGKPKGGTIVSEKKIDEIGVIEWKLSNGARVVLKPTNFKNDEIWMTGYSPGGTSIVSDADFIPASTATTVVSQGGLGEFDRNSLNKFLSDKVASASVGIGDLYEVVNGNSSNKDIETMFQLLYLSFTSPRKDQTAFEVYRGQLEGFLQNQGANPDQVFSDTVDYVSANYHFRAKPWTMETLNQLDLNKSFAIYKDRFADASDFTFFIVGSIDVQKIKPLVETYVASLPSMNRKETWKDVGMETPKGMLKKVVKKGVEEKARVQMTWTGTFDWSLENRHKFQSMIEVLRMKLRETLREEKGGVYSPGAYGNYGQYPKSEYELHVVFGCDPHRADELIADVEAIVKSLQNEKVDESYIDKVKEIQRRERETSLQQNRTWVNSLQFYYQNGENPVNIMKYGELYKSLNPATIQDQAKKYFGANRMTFILLPEEG